MTIVGALRVKNESRWIRRSIESILPICDEVIVFDDHSDDATVKICESLPKVSVLSSPFEGLNESRDKNFLLAAAGKPDWIVMIDGDEALMPGHAGALATSMRNAMHAVPVNAIARKEGSIRALAFNVLYLWDSEDQIRVDGVYRSMSRVSAFRPGGERFEGTRGRVNFHCGNCPQAIKDRTHAGVSLLHFGYLDRADRIRKYGWYCANDPDNAAEDNYKHIVVGDVFPADSRFRHGGPLKLETLPLKS